MELQWPLILFTLFVAWSCGLFATQGMVSLRKKSAKTMLASLITAVVLMAIGGVAVFFHLEHWDRIFNGFGRISSGITQELICIVVLIVLAVIAFVYIRRDAEKVPAWLNIAIIAVAFFTAGTTAHSYMMAARPAWNTVLWVACMIGNACILGPATFAVLDALRNKSEEEKPLLGKLMLFGAIVGVVAALAYVFSLATIGTSFEAVGYFYDPTEPMRKMVDASTQANLFADEYALLLWGGVVALGGVVPLVAAFAANKKPIDMKLLTSGALVLVAAIVGAVCQRMLFFMLGYSVFIFY